MKPIKVTALFEEYTNKAELSLEDQSLYNAAQKARNQAYAPYSKFQVGAAILLENGQMVFGNNQENAAYPSGMCAERVAIWHAGSEYPNIEIKKLFIAGSSKTNQLEAPVSPCGACRQAIAEYELKQGKPIEIFFTGATGKIIKANSIKDLLPLAFDNSLL